MDPSGRHEYRYWDGDHWTEHVSDHGVASTDLFVAAPFPGNSSRTIRLNGTPYEGGVTRSVFKPRELAWLDREFERLSANPEEWVPALTARLALHHVMRRRAQPMFGNTCKYRASYLLQLSVYPMLWELCISSDAHRAILAEHLAADRYAAEVLLNSSYYGATISRMQAEFADQRIADKSDDTKTCPFCAETIKAKAVVCRYCNRDLPAEA